ncbi:MAG: pyrimidine 5'-nucleotidase [Pseudomonadota bacterium]
MAFDALRQMETWVFDLDNTLYHPSARLFDQMNRKISAYMIDRLGVSEAEADRLRTDYLERHGATLHGLVEDHGVDPDDFLHHVHEIDLSALKPDPDLTAAIGNLSGRRIIHTNGARAHAERVLAARGLSHLFDEVYAIEDKDLVPKPQAPAYDKVIAAAGFDPARAAMVEDTEQNLAVPKARGMATIWVCHQDRKRAPGHVDHRVTRLAAFLGSL